MLSPYNDDHLDMLPITKVFCSAATCPTQQTKTNVSNHINWRRMNDRKGMKGIIQRNKGNHTKE